MNIHKFRGKRTDNTLRKGEWVYGSLIKMNESGAQSFILPLREYASTLSCGQLVAYNMIPVDYNTVGQYIGMKDKNEKEVYVGDVDKSEDNELTVVSFGLQCVDAFEGMGFNMWSFMERATADGKRLTRETNIIGNIYDNPELLEEIKSRIF